MSNIHIIYKSDRENFIEEFNTYLDEHSSGYLLVLSPEDTYGRGRQGENFEKEMADRLAEELDEYRDAVLATPKRLFQFPNRITGVMLRLEAVKAAQEKDGRKLRLNTALHYNYEADFLLRLIKGRSFKLVRGISYRQSEPGDANFREFTGIYDRDWYIDNMNSFIIPMLREYYEETGGESLPYLVQCYVLYNITCRLDANKNNANKHVLSEEEIIRFRELIAEALKFLDDDVIMAVRRYPIFKRDYQYVRMLLRLKHEGSDDTLEYVNVDNEGELSGIARTNNKESDFIVEDFHYGLNVRYPDLFIEVEGMPAYSVSRLRCNIQFIDYRDGRLEIDGSVPDIYSTEKVRYYFELNGEQYTPEFCERYSLTKFFGISAYKRYPFHVSIPVSGEGRIEFYLEYEGRSYNILFEFKSHTSRLAAYPHNSYWHFGDYLLTPGFTKNEIGGYLVKGMDIQKYSWPKMAAKEISIGAELLKSRKMHRFRFFLLRAAWVVTSPYFSKKNIWMFFDKIYKGGDSAEYLYKYTCDMMKEKKGPDKAYYLLDKDSSDYARLREEGYKPLKRGSFLHRLVFLNADMMIVTNSTVFAFNDYYMENSRYIRGIPDFHTVCVQHGLSVQKIALAQQRLRDNTRLYFCASKYEIDNLSHPVYDYNGYDALKLTGVPRYDGLVDESKKQIMISPTWRMQSAVRVTKNEGVERDYNPYFKETPYFKVYNSLINDSRLISAAEQYGYRISYVLHPIVSPQAEDFDKNDYVDIIPSVGDMSYEKMFRESSLMVTDYSGIQFDFAYMRKPLVYYHPEELEAHYEEGSFHYDTMAFGEIVKRKDELINLLIEYMKDGCHMKELYRRRADDFFEFDDHENCHRIFDEIVRYQKTVKGEN